MAKIVQVCNTNFYLNKFLKPLVLEHANDGHEVICITSSGDVDKEMLENPSVEIITFDYPQKASPVAFAKAIYRFYKILKPLKADLVNSHNRNASIIARVATFLCGKPVNLYTAHGMYFHDNQGKVGYYLSLMVELFLYLLSDHCLSQSKEDIEVMSKYPFFKRENYTYIGNGINHLKFASNKRKPSEEFVITAIGRLVKGKGIGDLIEAFNTFVQKHPESRLVIIGGNIARDIDPVKNEIFRFVKDNNLQDKIKITGIVNDVENYLCDGSLFVLPSYREGVPRAMLEAMCMGIPVLASNIRGPREVLVDNENGFLFKVKDVKSMESRLEEIYQMHKDQIKFVSLKGEKTILDFYREDLYVKRQTQQINKFAAPPEVETEIKLRA